jgi:hypothetical protein
VAQTKALYLFACYRRADAVDAQMYHASVAAILAEYPQAIVDYVCDPRTGLPRSLKWLPSIAEIAEACDERVEFAKRLESFRPLVEQRRAVQADPAASDAAKAEAKKWLDARAFVIENNGL